MDEATRASLVTALLDLASKDALDFETYYKADRVATLSHAELSDQLLPWLTDVSSGERSRELAVVLAGASRKADLHDVLVTIALDTSEPSQLRRACGTRHWHGRIRCDKGSTSASFLSHRLRLWKIVTQTINCVATPYVLYGLGIYRHVDLFCHSHS